MSTSLTKSTAVMVSDLLDKNRSKIIKSLPNGFNYDRMCRTVVNAVSVTPKIAECTAGSIFLSCVKAFTMGLEPNGALAEGYLVPFRNNNKGVMECQFMPGYRGLINLVRRSGQIANIYASAIHKNDTIEIQEGTTKSIVHKPDYFGDRGVVVGYYAVMVDKEGNSDFEVMSIGEIEKIRKRSKSANNGPWVTDFDEMAKKTVLKRLMKRAPMSIELAKGVESDNKISMGEPDDGVIDIDGIEIPDDMNNPKSSFEQVEENGTSGNNDKTVDELLANAPVTLADIKDYLKSQKKKFSEDDVKNNLKSYVSQTLDWKDNNNGKQ